MAFTVAPARHVKMHLKNQATRIDGVMKIQKMSITNTVNKCLLLIKQFKSEQEHANSILIKQTANDFNITHRKLFEQLTELEESMQKYMILSVQAASELGKGVLEQQILGQLLRWAITRVLSKIYKKKTTQFIGIFILY